MSAGAAGADSVTAVVYAGWQPSEKATVRLSVDIARQTKVKKAHREAENRRRHGLSQKKQKNMDDASSTRLPGWCMELFGSFRKRFL